jgi:hypothetical protein
MKNTDSAKTHPFPSLLFLMVKILRSQRDEFCGYCFNSSHKTQATVLIYITGEVSFIGALIKKILREQQTHPFHPLSYLSHICRKHGM